LESSGRLSLWVGIGSIVLGAAGVFVFIAFDFLTALLLGGLGTTLGIVTWRQGRRALGASGMAVSLAPLVLFVIAVLGFRMAGELSF